MSWNWTIPILAAFIAFAIFAAVIFGMPVVGYYAAPIVKTWYHYWGLG